MNEAAVIRALVVDDEPHARAIVRKMLAQEHGWSVVGEAASGPAAIELIAREAPDVVFLDVEMPGMSGLEVVEGIGVDRMPYVVFITAFDHYAVRAFDVHAVDYLLKPVGRRRFRAALVRAKESMANRNLARGLRGSIEAILSSSGSNATILDRLAVASDGGVAFVAARDAEWIEAEGKYVRVHAGGKVYPLHESLKELEGKLDPVRFLRVHRSSIVNVDHIMQVHPLFKGTFVITLASGSRVTTGATYREVIRALCANRPTNGWSR